MLWCSTSRPTRERPTSAATRAAMDSKAAARTWGLLRGEGRWIAAALTAAASEAKADDRVRGMGRVDRSAAASR